MIAARHQARKRAVDLLFEAEARGITPAEVAEARNALAEKQSDVSPLNPYTVTVARGVTEHAAHIDDLISAHLQGWTLERLPAVDRAILRVAVWELLHADDVPEPVAVDEAVELAKQLSTDDSPGFVNGVLGQVMLVTPQIRAAAAADAGDDGRGVMGIPQDWAPYSSVEEAAKVYLRDPDLALDQLRSVVDLAAIKSFIMSRGTTEESWGEAVWQEVVLTDGHRLIMWRADDELSTAGDRERRVLNASVRTILLSTITDHVLTTEYEVLGDDTRRLSEVRLRMYTQLVTRSRQKSATDTDIFCESFRYLKSVDDGGLAQMQRLLQFGRVLSRCMQ